MTRPTGSWYLTVCLVLWMSRAWPVGSAGAQSAAKIGPAGYREAVDEAVLEFRAHSFEESRALFAHAHALYSNARTLRGLSMAEFELRSYADCVRHLEAALRSRERPLDDTLRADTQQLLTRARAFVARLFVTTQPTKAEIVLDGRIAQTAAGEALLLDAGNHVLEARAFGYLPERQHLNLRGGEMRAVTVSLSSSTVRASAMAASAPADAVTLRSGARFSGTVLAILPNDRVDLRTADGTARRFQWSDVARVQDNHKVYEPVQPATVSEMLALTAEYSKLPARALLLGMGALSGGSIVGGIIGAALSDGEAPAVRIGIGVGCAALGVIAGVAAIILSSKRRRGLKRLRDRGFIVPGEVPTEVPLVAFRVDSRGSGAVAPVALRF